MWHISHSHVCVSCLCLFCVLCVCVLSSGHITGQVSLCRTVNRMMWYPGKDAGNSSFCLQAPERCGLGMLLTITMCSLCQHSGSPAQPTLVIAEVCPCSNVLVALNSETTVEATLLRYPKHLNRCIR